MSHEQFGFAPWKWKLCSNALPLSCKRATLMVTSKAKAKKENIRDADAKAMRRHTSTKHGKPVIQITKTHRAMA